MAEHVYEEMLYMRTRSETMQVSALFQALCCTRNLDFVFQAASEGMRGRLLWVELMMMCIVLIMGLWQIQYLKRYFQVGQVRQYFICKLLMHLGFLSHR